MGTTKDEVLGSLHRCIMLFATDWARTSFDEELTKGRAEGAMWAFSFVANRLKLDPVNEILEEYRAMLGSEF